MKIIDSHCHLNLKPLFSSHKKDKDHKLDWPYFWQKAKKNNVAALIVPGTNLETSKKAFKIASHSNQIFAGGAIHPSELEINTNLKKDTLPKSILEQLKQLELLIKENSAIAIGETGLDYYHLKRSNNLNITKTISLQKKLFIKHIELANQLKLPIIIHARDKKDCQQEEQCAYYDVLNLIKDFYQFNQPAIFHCISGPKDYIKQIVSLNSYISVAGNITYPSAQQIRAIVKHVPREKLIVETDAPYLSPQTVREEFNQPAHIKYTIKFLEKNMGIKAERLYKNSLTAFDLPLN